MAAFIELTLSKGYARVAIGDITRKANIGRSTFYLHYANKQSLLQESLRGPNVQLARAARRDATPHMLLPVLCHFREQRTINRVFFQDPIKPLWVKTLAGVLERNLGPHTSVTHRQAPMPRALRPLVVAEVLIALVAHWLADAAPSRPEEIAQALISSARALLR